MREAIDRSVVEPLVAAVAPEQIELALKAADTVTDRRSCPTRVVQLHA